MDVINESFAKTGYTLMMMRKNADKVAKSPKASGPSVMGTLFNPRLGTMFTPFRDNFNIFTQLVAMVFSLYGLFPKDHPYLKDAQAAPLSFFQVLLIARQRIAFTKEGLPRTLIFFGIIAMMLFSALVGVLALMAAFATKAHAGVFDPASQDIAQSWINYIFRSGSWLTIPGIWGDTESWGLDDPFTGSTVLQTAFTTVLAFYSNAILIVAGLILFYHLTVMVVETASTGTPLGKQSRQIWAPIRLVFAIGLLVPISDGLNCGQYIVIKAAELGSGMASQAWIKFLTVFQSYNLVTSPPAAGDGSRVAEDLAMMYACRAAWNKSIENAQSAGSYNVGLDGERMGSSFTCKSSEVGGRTGQVCSLSGTSLGDQYICGWYFIPDGNNEMEKAAATAQANAIKNSDGAFTAAATEIEHLLPEDGSTITDGNPVDISSGTFLKAISTYQDNLNKEIAALANNSSEAKKVDEALQKMKAPGWAMAGAFLNAISRIQGNMAGAARSTRPVTHQPLFMEMEPIQNPSEKGFWSRMWSGSSNVRYNIQNALWQYMDVAKKQTISGGSGGDLQCAAMAGLTRVSAGTGVSDFFFGIIDWMAQINGVWQSGNGKYDKNCGNGSSTYFKPGIIIDGNDPFGQLSRLGHANISLAIDLVSYGMFAQVAGGAVGLGASALGGFGGKALGFLGGGISMMSGPMYFGALIFWISGFILAFMVPLMPFMRFFFAVLSWIAALLEAVVAVPLIALAHLNPDGEGLPGPKAQQAYYFTFNLFLRPILLIFALICSLIMFLIALSFLNFAYSVAVAGVGGTSFGHAALSKIFYSVLYVGIVYVCANHSFQLIDHLPQNALQWMGATGQSMPTMGDVNRIESLGSAAGGVMGQQAMTQMQNFGGAAKGLIDDKIGGPIGKAREKSETSAAHKAGWALAAANPGSAEADPEIANSLRQTALLESLHGAQGASTPPASVVASAGISGGITPSGGSSSSGSSSASGSPSGGGGNGGAFFAGAAMASGQYGPNMPGTNAFGQTTVNYAASGSDLNEQMASLAKNQEALSKDINDVRSDVDASKKNS